jgi:hypothetical protein
VDLPTVMQLLKGRSSIAINRLLGRKGIPVWQQSYQDRVIRNDQELEKFRYYIETNPMRAFVKRG